VSTYDAEYLALTQLQGDAFVTLDLDLARRAEGIVAVATVNDLRADADRVGEQIGQFEE
jgi:hypothetical protein